MKNATKINELTVFNWTILKMSMKTGKSYGAMIGVDSPRSSVGTVTLFTKGRIEENNLSNGEKNQVRIPGAISTEFGLLKAGRYVFTALEDSEWWCIDQKMNNYTLPAVTLVKAKANETITGKCFVCSGVDEGKSSIDYVTKDECLVLVFE